MNENITKTVNKEVILCPIDVYNPSYNALETANYFALEDFSVILIVSNIISLPKLYNYELFINYSIRFFQSKMQSIANKLLDRIIKRHIDDRIIVSKYIMCNCIRSELAKVIEGYSIELAVFSQKSILGWKNNIYKKCFVSLIHQQPFSIYLTD